MILSSFAALFLIGLPQNPPPSTVPANPNRIYQLRALSRRWVKTPKTSIPVWVMDTESKRAEGMMFLTNKEVKDTEGMLFVFPDESPRSFWMRNTILPLDICYLTKSGKVLNVAKARPYDESPVPSSGSATYVLELKLGMAAKLGVKPGVTLKVSL
jgi:uncharacterized membrane protein (UPF0127 family)